MKYGKEIVEKITQALCDGQGRVRACKIAGIHYDTFMVWMRSKPEFAEAVKKAEATGNDKIKDICQRRIIEDKSWQSAAWWLERNYPDQYSLKQRHDFTSGGQKIEPINIQVVSEDAKDNLKQLIAGGSHDD